jgi:DNA-binding transcriptional regulator YiaG
LPSSRHASRGLRNWTTGWQRLKQPTTCIVPVCWMPQGTRRSRCGTLAQRLARPNRSPREESRALREHAHLSQAVFAHYLGLMVGYVSQIERGAKRPSGPARVLLNLIRRMGIEAIL